MVWTKSNITKKALDTKSQGHVCMCAKSLQSCPTLWDTIDCSPPGSSVHGILQATGCNVLFQGIFPTRVSNPGLLGLLHWQAGSLPLAPPGKPIYNCI